MNLFTISPRKNAPSLSNVSRPIEAFADEKVVKFMSILWGIQLQLMAEQYSLDLTFAAMTASFSPNARLAGNKGE